MVETFACGRCGATWTRPRSRGRKPRYCSARCQRAGRPDNRGSALHLGGPGYVVLGRRGTPLERFMCKVSKSPSGCWLWLGSRNGKGYGLFYDERTRKAHRWIYEQSHGSIPAGLTIDHICGVHHCVNPEHMEPVTALENARRGRLAAA